jgi:hypothetical protein
MPLWSCGNLRGGEFARLPVARFPRSYLRHAPQPRSTRSHGPPWERALKPDHDMHFFRVALLFPYSAFFPTSCRIISGQGVGPDGCLFERTGMHSHARGNEYRLPFAHRGVYVGCIAKYGLRTSEQTGHEHNRPTNQQTPGSRANVLQRSLFSAENGIRI